MTHRHHWKWTITVYWPKIHCRKIARIQTVKHTLRYGGYASLDIISNLYVYVKLCISLQCVLRELSEVWRQCNNCLSCVATVPVSVNFPSLVDLLWLQYLLIQQIITDLQYWCIMSHIYILLQVVQNCYFNNHVSK